MSVLRCLGLLCLVLTSCTKVTPATDSAPAPPPRVSATTPAREIRPEPLYDAYVENAAEAQRTFKDKVLKVEGRIKSVQSEFGNPSVRLFIAKDEALFLRCLFEEKDQAEIAALQPGSEITIQGVCAGPIEGYVTLEHCIVRRYRPVKP